MPRPAIRFTALLQYALFALLLSANALSASAQPLPITVALNATGLADRIPISISPDGRFVAYTLLRSSAKEPFVGKSLNFSVSGVMEEAFGTDIWITDTVTGRTQNLTQGKAANYDPAWSPNSRYLAFFSDRDGADRLWIWDRSTQRLRRVSSAIIHAFFTFEVPRWMPDGKQVIVKLLPAGMSIASVAAAAEQSTGAAQSPGAPIVYMYDPSQQASVAQTPSRDPNALIVSAFQKREWGDLASVDIATGAVRRLVTGIEPLGWWLSPDGRHLAFTALRGFAGETSQQPLFDLRVLDMTTLATVTTASLEPLGYGVTVSWSPDNAHLAFVTAGQDEVSATKASGLTRGDAYLATIEGSAPVNLTLGDHPSFYSDLRAPRWSSDGSRLILMSDTAIYEVTFPSRKLRAITTFSRATVLGVVGNPLTDTYWSNDSGSIYTVTRNTSTYREGIVRVAINSGRQTNVFDDSFRFGDIDMAMGASQNHVVAYVAEDAKYGQQLYVTKNGFATRAALRKFSPELANYALGSSRLITFRTATGMTLHAALLLPGDYQPGHRYPLVVRVYGGELSSESVNRLGLEGYGPDNMQILASRGYAVLEPDTPLRPGYPMHDLAADVIPAIDKVIALGIADPNRLAVEGHSYGGYSTLALIVQSTRFKAAIDSAGVTDLFSAYGEFDGGESWAIGWSEEGQGRMRGTPWQYPTRYFDNSPYFFLNRVQTPLLIVHGDADTTVPIAQTDMVFVALRRLGKEVEYVVYPGEDHWQGTWKPANVIDYWNRSIEFLNKHV